MRTMATMIQTAPVLSLPPSRPLSLPHPPPRPPYLPFHSRRLRVHRLPHVRVDLPPDLPRSLLQPLQGRRREGRGGGRDNGMNGWRVVAFRGGRCHGNEYGRETLKEGGREGERKGDKKK